LRPLSQRDSIAANDFGYAERLLAELVPGDVVNSDQARDREVAQ
jgi:hypothetical protein